MDKIDQLLDALDHPERYSDSDLDSILDDAEAKEVFNLLDKTSASLHPVGAPDVDAEWRKFRRAQWRRNLRIPGNIAAALAIGIASFAAVAAIVGVGIDYFSTPKPHADVTTETHAEAPATLSEDEYNAPETETVVFDNESFDSIINRVAEHYGYKTVFVTETSKQLRLYFRWNPAQPIAEVVESLNNFKQIHISVKDNTLIID